MYCVCTDQVVQAVPVLTLFRKEVSVKLILTLSHAKEVTNYISCLTLSQVEKVKVLYCWGRAQHGFSLAWLEAA